MLGFARDFVRTIELCVDPNFFGLAEGFGEAFCNARGICADGACADAHEVDLIKRGKGIDELHDLFVGQGEDVAA